jgi:hypothetical protein
MEPVYRNIEFCRDPETLWRKMREGRWDWLGVHRNGQFVVGSPRRSGVMSASISAEHLPAGYEMDHGVRVRAEPDANLVTTWCRDAREAEHVYRERIEEFTAKEGPLVVMVERIEGQVAVEKELVVKRPSTYDWRPPPAA